MTPTPPLVDLDATFAKITEFWSPVVLSDLNGQQVKAVRIKGEFQFHKHTHEDEMFLVHRGSFVMEFRDRRVQLGAGQYIVVPRGVEHRPVADEACELILFEPASTIRTGD